MLRKPKPFSIYNRYLELKCVRLLKEDLTDRVFIPKKVDRKKDIPFPAGYSIRFYNPIYIGQIRHKGICHPGQHKAIIDQELWDRCKSK